MKRKVNENSEKMTCWLKEKTTSIQVHNLNVNVRCVFNDSAFSGETDELPFHRHRHVMSL